MQAETKFTHVSHTTFFSENRFAERTTLRRFLALNEDSFFAERFEHAHNCEHFAASEENAEHFERVASSETVVARVKISRNNTSCVYVSDSYIRLCDCYIARDEVSENLSSEEEIAAYALSKYQEHVERVFTLFSEFLREEKQLAQKRRAAALAMKKKVKLDDEEI